MSGHSKWATIKHKKSKEDAKRGMIFTKLIKEITIAARMGGGDPDKNPRLRTAISSAKDANMPSTNVERAIKKGTGELPGVHYEEFTYEGYGPGGVAMYLIVFTDNKNRTTAEVRHLFTRFGGNLGEQGCVSWMFHRRGLITLDSSTVKDEDSLMLTTLDAGAEDVSLDGNQYEILTKPDDLEKVKEAIVNAGYQTEVAEISMIPETYVKIDGKQAEQMTKLMDALEEHDDVQNVYANFDIPDEVLESA